MNDPATTPPTAEAAAAPDPSPSTGESASGSPSDSGSPAESPPVESSTPAESSSPTGSPSSQSDTSSASAPKDTAGDTNGSVRLELADLHQRLKGVEEYILAATNLDASRAQDVQKLREETSDGLSAISQSIAELKRRVPGTPTSDMPLDMLAIGRAIKGLVAGIKAVDPGFDLETSCNKQALTDPEPAPVGG